VRVLIAFRSRYGATARCAAELAALLGPSESVLVDLASRHVPPVESFDVVLVGGSIYGGRIQRAVTSFCENNQRVLLQRPVGLFVCSFFGGEQARAQIDASFPAALLASAFARVPFGGELHLGSLRLLDRLLVRSLAPASRDVDLVRHEAITGLADTVNALSAGPGLSR
jgi:menaquinone-dependent protoporphyrinogen oxidase